MVVGEFFKTARSIFVNQSTTIHNIVAILIVYGFEALVSSAKLFDCPSKGYGHYGRGFIIGPAVILLFISMLVRDDFRKVVQGCCRDPEAAKDDRCPCTSKPQWCSCMQTMKLIKIFMQSAMAGCVWIFWAFFQKEYYTCSILGRKASRLNEASTAAKKKQIEDDYTAMNDHSQFISLIFLVALLGLALFCLAIHYCCYERPYSGLPEPYKYHKLEAQAAAKAYKEKMEDFAQNEGKRQAEMFFSQDPDKEKEAPAAGEASDASRVQTAGEDKAAAVTNFAKIQQVYKSIVEHYPRFENRGKSYQSVDKVEVGEEATAAVVASSGTGQA